MEVGPAVRLTQRRLVSFTKYDDVHREVGFGSEERSRICGSRQERVGLGVLGHE